MAQLLSEQQAKRAFMLLNIKNHSGVEIVKSIYISLLIRIINIK